MLITYSRKKQNKLSHYKFSSTHVILFPHVHICIGESVHTYIIKHILSEGCYDEFQNMPCDPASPEQGEMAQDKCSIPN